VYRQVEIVYHPSKMLVGLKGRLISVRETMADEPHATVFLTHKVQLDTKEYRSPYMDANNCIMCRPTEIKILPAKNSC
jgi:hypothetical protein